MGNFLEIDGDALRQGHKKNPTIRPCRDVIPSDLEDVLLLAQIDFLLGKKKKCLQRLARALGLSTF